jgi:hypothetical protein
MGTIVGGPYGRTTSGAPMKNGPNDKRVKVETLAERRGTVGEQSAAIAALARMDARTPRAKSPRARGINRLPATFLKLKPGLHSDGNNLYLQVTEGPHGNHRRSWIFRYQMPGPLPVGKKKSGGLRTIWGSVPQATFHSRRPASLPPNTENWSSGASTRLATATLRSPETWQRMRPS